MCHNSHAVKTTYIRECADLNADNDCSNYEPKWEVFKNMWKKVRKFLVLLLVVYIFFIIGVRSPYYACVQAKVLVYVHSYVQKHTGNTYSDDVQIVFTELGFSASSVLSPFVWTPISMVNNKELYIKVKEAYTDEMNAKLHSLQLHQQERAKKLNLIEIPESGIVYKDK